MFRTSRNHGNQIFIALAFGCVAILIAGCSSLSGPGKRIKEGFDASNIAKTVEFKGMIKLDMPAALGMGGPMRFAFTGRFDANGTIDDKDDDLATMSFTIATGGDETVMQFTQIGMTEYLKLEGQVIGGPAVPNKQSEEQWQKFLAVLADAVQDLKQAESETVAGQRLEVFSASLPKDAVCGKLLPLLNEIGRINDGESVDEPNFGEICVKTMQGDANLRVGLGESDWPWLIAADAKLEVASLMSQTMGAELPEGAIPELDAMSVPASVRLEVIQYDRPIESIVAPAGAPVYDSRSEFESAVNKLTG